MVGQVRCDPGGKPSCAWLVGPEKNELLALVFFFCHCDARELGRVGTHHAMWNDGDDGCMVLWSGQGFDYGHIRCR